jgi:hypothetical protein
MTIGAISGDPLQHAAVRRRLPDDHKVAVSLTLFLDALSHSPLTEASSTPVAGHQWVATPVVSFKLQADALAISPQGNLVAVYQPFRSMLYLLDAKKCTVLGASCLFASERYLKATLAFCEGGEKLLIAYTDGPSCHVHSISLDTLKLEEEVGNFALEADGLALSPAGDYLYAYKGSQVFQIDLEDQEEIVALPAVHRSYLRIQHLLVNRRGDLGVHLAGDVSRGEISQRCLEVIRVGKAEWRGPWELGSAESLVGWHEGMPICQSFSTSPPFSSEWRVEPSRSPSGFVPRLPIRLPEKGRVGEEAQSSYSEDEPRELSRSPNPQILTARGLDGLPSLQQEGKYSLKQVIPSSDGQWWAIRKNFLATSGEDREVTLFQRYLH